jgi:hypothetical protein
MTIQNQIEAAKYSLFIRIIVAIIPFNAILLYFTKDSTGIIILGVVLSLLVLVYLSILFRWPHYFWYSDLEKDVILIRYYNVHLFLRKPKQLKIKKGTISDYKITSLFNGWTKSLVISVLTPNGVANYAPIYISLINDKDLEKLKKSLDTWKRK